jgi:hypothetical protein
VNNYTLTSSCFGQSWILGKFWSGIYKPHKFYGNKLVNQCRFSLKNLQTDQLQFRAKLDLLDFWEEYLKT